MKILDYVELTIHIRSKVYLPVRIATIVGVDDFVRDYIHSNGFDMTVDTLDHIHAEYLIIASAGISSVLEINMLLPSL